LLIGESLSTVRLVSRKSERRITKNIRAKCGRDATVYHALSNAN
jgi:hypothetical protein